MEYPLGECKSCDALADQIAKLTKTNLAQAAQIEAYLTVLERIAKLGNEPHYGNSLGNEIARKALSITPSQALKAFSNVLRNEAIEQAAVASWMHYIDTCKRLKINASEHGEWLCADAIRNLKELP